MRNAHDYLAGGNDLPRLRQRFHYHAVRVSHHDIARCDRNNGGIRLPDWPP